MRERRIYRQEFFNSFNQEEQIFDMVTLKELIEQTYGESNFLDFKEKFIKEDHIAQLILAMANSGGGTIIFGINDDNVPVGLPKEEEKIDQTDLERKINNYLPDEIKYTMYPIKYEEKEEFQDFSGKIFYVLYIPKQNRYIPFLAKKQGEKLKTNIVYIRKNTSVEAASNNDLEAIFKLRLIEQYKDLSNMKLDEHISQLRILYGSLEKQISSGNSWSEAISVLQKSLAPFSNTTIENPNYPEEDFEDFINKMIEKKKRKIEIVLEVTNID